jgi:hypothetical protein
LRIGRKRNRQKEGTGRKRVLKKSWDQREEGPRGRRQSKGVKELTLRNGDTKCCTERGGQEVKDVQEGV